MQILHPVGANFADKLGNFCIRLYANFAKCKKMLGKFCIRSRAKRHIFILYFYKYIYIYLYIFILLSQFSGIVSLFSGDNSLFSGMFFPFFGRGIPFFWVIGITQFSGIKNLVCLLILNNQLVKLV